MSPSNLLVFEQEFPDGASGVNITAPVNSTGALREFASSNVPSTQFPVFSEGAAPAATSAGYVTWGGRFFQANVASSGGVNAAFLAAAVGAEGGPIVVFER